MAAYYSTAPLRATLNELVDFSRVKQCAPRLSVGAANVRTAEMHYFDSREMKLGVDHVMASGALPPAFPAIRIDGELYWDGGICSNTPVEAVFDDYPRRNSVVFTVHIWNPQGPDPETIWQVLSRQKDIQYSSRAISHITRQKQIHRLRHIIAELAKRLPERERQSDEVSELAGYGCLTRMHVVRLLAPPMEGEDHTKDIDFSSKGILVSLASRIRRNETRAGTGDCSISWLWALSLITTPPLTGALTGRRALPSRPRLRLGRCSPASRRFASSAFLARPSRPPGSARVGR